MSNTAETRTERDSMGEMQVPANAYYGASTQRAVLNFPISDLRFPRQFIRALGQIKQAAARVNAALGTVDPQVAEAIDSAAQEVVDGKRDDNFVLDIFQTGSGTSTNMNANEVIANRASELLGEDVLDKSALYRGPRKVHPNDHVNFGQSSNDVIPTAIHLAALVSIEHELLPALQQLRTALQQKADEFMPVIKTGRTHLQDATPIRLGQEFLGYTGQIERAIARMHHAQQELSEVALGGTAVGTGVNTHPEFSARVCQLLSEMNGVTVRETSNHFQAQSTLDNIVEASGSLNTLAVSLMKIANDIRWLGSGPRAGIGEIELPAVQPGSSIMPGKVNPVIAESVCMVCAQVIGNHTTITVAGQSGNFEINVMMPVTAYNLLQSISLLASVSRNFTEQCIKGLQATTRGPEMVERGLAISTSLAPIIGYDAAADISKIAHKTGKTVREVASEKTNLSEEELDRILDPASMTRPGLEGGPAGG
ncbi:MAG TPA: class II fumarate hydratase [Ktedonobacteraceae bacterium]